MRRVFNIEKKIQIQNEAEGKSKFRSNYTVVLCNSGTMWLNCYFRYQTLQSDEQEFTSRTIARERISKRRMNSRTIPREGRTGPKILEVPVAQKPEIVLENPLLEQGHARQTEKL